MSIKLNGVLVTPTIFPDGTSQVWKLGEISGDSFVIDWEFESEAEVIQVMQLARLVQEEAAGGCWELVLNAPYFPYARQDKWIGNDECFAGHVLVEILEDVFDRVVTFDIHNPDLFNDRYLYFDNHLPLKEIANALDAVNGTVIVFPDEGAADRYEFTKGWARQLIYKKDRDAATGEIRGLSLDSGDRMEPNEVVLIVDDICDGGRTFIEVAKALPPEVVEIHLYVSHGIFSKGLDVLREAGIQRIFTRKGEVV